MNFQKIACIFFALFFALPFLFAQNSGEERPQGDPRQAAPKEEPKQDSPAADSKPKPEYPPLASLIDGMQKKEGFFTLYQKDEKLYALISGSRLKKPFYMATTISGGIFAGMQWDEMLVYWEKQGKLMLLIRPDVSHRAEKTTMEDVVERTFPSTIIRAVPILSEGDGGYLVDFEPIFKSDLAGISRFSKFFAGAAGMLNPRLSKWSKVKVFPHNVELAVDAAFTGSRTEGGFSEQMDSSRSYKVGFHYSLAYIPKTGYKPRMGDTRVGYFYTAVKDFSKSYSERTHFSRMIHRWNLEKADPTLEVSPPKKPIVFYLEKSVPYRFRRYVREGILEWNKAFEKVGFVDAVVVHQQTDTDFADLDPEDVRYNFFRWTTHDLGFAAGPSRVNPLTGEILDADIIFDDSVVRGSTKEYKRWNHTEAFFQNVPEIESIVEKFPGWDFLKHAAKESKSSLHLEAYLELEKEMQAKGKCLCTLAQGMEHQVALAVLSMKARGVKEVPEEFMGAIVKEIVMHEVGHTLGLFHNFKGSSWLPLAKINSKEKPLATSGSIMDYNPMNFVPKGEIQGSYLPLALGPYDYWAIEYGYKVADKMPEPEMLAKIASRCAEDGLAYGNDYFASYTDPDPHIGRFDFTSDNIEFAELRFRLAQELAKDALERLVAEGEDFFPIRQAMNVIMNEYGRKTIFVSKYIGGLHIHFDHKGDPNRRAPVQVVSAKKQREAFEFLAKNVFSEKAFDFSPELMKHLSPGTWSHWSSPEQTKSPIYDLRQNILMNQATSLLILLNPDNLARLSNHPAYLAKGEDVFTIAELLDGLTKTIWSELDKSFEGQKFDAQNPFVSDARRNLQMMHIALWREYFILMPWRPNMPQDAKSIASRNFQELQEKLDKVLAQKEAIDRVSYAHLFEIRNQIEHTLKAKYRK